MKIILSICLIFVLSSCSTLKKDIIDYSESYITGVGAESLSSEEIRKNLKRNTTMAGGNYGVEAYPISKAYINSYIKEISAARSSSPSEVKSLSKRLNEKFINNKACIDININIKEFERVNKLENWRIELIDSKNISYSLKWLPEPPSNTSLPKPISSQRNTYHGKETMWFLAGQACTEAIIELRKGFKVVFKPSFVQWPFASQDKIEWSFDYTEIIDGKKVFKEKKKKKVEGYRGW